MTEEKKVPTPKPKKKPLKVPPELTHADGWHFQFVHGWNSCIKAMKGERDDKA